MSDLDRRPCGSGGGRTRSAVAANVTGTGGQRSDLARRGARYPTAAAEQGSWRTKRGWAFGPAGCLDSDPVMILVSDDSKGPGGGRYSPLWEQALSCDQSPRRDIPVAYVKLCNIEARLVEHTIQAFVERVTRAPRQIGAGDPRRRLPPPGATPVHYHGQPV